MRITSNNKELQERMLLQKIEEDNDNNQPHDGVGRCAGNSDGDQHRGEGSVVDAVDTRTMPSEWRLMFINGRMFATVTPGYESKHFRRAIGTGKTTGECTTAIPIKTYMDLTTRVTNISTTYSWYRFISLHLFPYILFFTILTILYGTVTMIIFPEDDNVQEIDTVGKNLVFFGSLGFAVYTVLVVWQYIAWRIYKNMDDQITTMVEELQQEYKYSYGVLIGYRPYTKDCSSRRPNVFLWRTNMIFNKESSNNIEGSPCVWLQGLHHQEGTINSEGNSTIMNSNANSNTDAINTTTSTTTTTDEMTDSSSSWNYPPIFVYNGIPGQVHMGEKYHPSTGYDHKTWTLITETYQKHMATPCPVTTLSILFFVFVLLYALFVNPFIIVKYGLLWGMLVSGLVGSSIGGYMKLLDLWWTLPALKRVEREVTKNFQQQHEDGSRLVINFVDTSLPFRTENRMCRRYEVVVELGQHCSSSSSPHRSGDNNVNITNEDDHQNGEIV
jgi:hypothetical protein